MKPISTSTYTFSDLVGGGYVYVDKTADIHTIAAQAKGQYFIARPRRFGKSLLISTLQCLFEGRRELFSGLAIDSLPWDWTTPTSSSSTGRVATDRLPIAIVHQSSILIGHQSSASFA